MKIVLYSFLILISVLAIQEVSAVTDKVVCYYGSWATYRPGRGKFDVEHIDPRLCTHFIYTFVGLNYDGSIRVLDPYNDLEENWGKGAFKRFNRLKERNPKAKTIIAIGGWNEGSESYSHVMNDTNLRKKFVQEAVNFTLRYGFDGFDLDWEYPNQRGGKPYDVANFVQVLKELRTEFDKHGLLLSSAVASAEFSVKKSYDIPQVTKYLDIINVMTYDLHGAWDKETGHNSPLYPSSQDVSEQQKQLNIAACINYWISQGADPSKIVLGMATYGRTFTLDDPKNNGIGAPASQPGNAGPYTRQPGILGFNEILELQGQGGWTVVWDKEQQVPYMFKGNQWIGYDNPSSIKLKVEWARNLGLGGVMIWSLETDDFPGLLGIKFGLLHAINSALGNEILPEIPTTQDPTAPTTEKPNLDGICKTEGFVRDANDCSVFYQCVRTNDGLVPVSFKCAEGLFFDPETNTCNYPWNVVC